MITFHQQGHRWWRRAWSLRTQCACWKHFVKWRLHKSYWALICASISNLLANCEPQPLIFHIGPLSADSAVSDDVAPLCCGAPRCARELLLLRALLIGRLSFQTAGYLRTAGWCVSATPVGQLASACLHFQCNKKLNISRKHRRNNEKKRILVVWSEKVCVHRAVLHAASLNP